MPAERRLHPRVAAEIEAEIRDLDDQSPLSARLLNISLGGLRIGGPATLRDQLLAATKTFPVEAIVSFSLPRGGVTLTCRHIHTFRLSADAFEFGFKILQCHDDARNCLEAYIAQQLSGSRDGKRNGLD